MPFKQVPESHDEKEAIPTNALWNKRDNCQKSNVRYESAAFQTTDMDTVGIVPNDFHGDVPNVHWSRAPSVIHHFTDLVRLPGI